MKFVVLFVVCLAAFAAADEKPKESKSKTVVEKLTEETFKQSIEGLKKEYGITCENHEEKCNQYAFGEDNLSSKIVNAAKEECIIVMKGYLCEGKNEGEKLTALFTHFLQTVEALEN